MNQPKRFSQILKRRLPLATIALLLGLLVLRFTADGQDKSSFPDGFDAVQAAPKSHKVIFENGFVRVLEVSVSPGTTVPMHHHRWPSLLLNWDTGGKTPHVRYRRPDGSVRDIPSTDEAIHPGAWSVEWMKPEPMHAVEIVEAQDRTALPKGPPDLRIEIKCRP
jgi:predicted metal-dependent enzyme (double-stranded beta helix superfamily)